MGAHLSYAVLPRQGDVRLVLKAVARKQLLTLKVLAESDQRRTGASSRTSSSASSDS